MPTRWIDFRSLKTRVPIREVLARYGYLESLRDKGKGRLAGSCPIHGGKSGNSFHVDTEKNVFNCFSGCGGGNVLDLVMKVENCDIREAAEMLADWFKLTFDRSAGSTGGSRMSEGKRPTSQPADRRPTGSPAADSCVASGAEGEVINPPLAAPLKTLNQDHPYLWSRGLTAATIKFFGVGFCSRGLMKGRIAIPIHNERGELVAYAGRAIEDELAQGEAKYKLPAGFQKSHVVWNLNRAKENAARGLHVVEGFFGAIRLHQAGFPNVVALMGSSLSEAQETLLLAATDRLSLMFDGDEAGAAGLTRAYGRLRRRMYLREIHLEDGEQPDSLSDERLRTLLA
jgi:DNA primase (bacterial type)